MALIGVVAFRTHCFEIVAVTKLLLLISTHVLESDRPAKVW
ncbi:hypothetical protein [Xylella fastidiosa]|nr:hypothetical protein [Xylella fastidiosa]ERI60113.1 hypothetical protein M233_05835 [Xylella fastidiosa subsp. multiplex Griffin-1]